MGELVANNGTYILNNLDDNSFSKPIDAIVVLEDTIFNAIYIDGNPVTSDYISNSSIAIKAGAIITPINDLQFSGVNLVSGSVALVLG